MPLRTEIAHDGALEPRPGGLDGIETWGVDFSYVPNTRLVFPMLDRATRFGAYLLWDWFDGGLLDGG